MKTKVKQTAASEDLVLKSHSKSSADRLPSSFKTGMTKTDGLPLGFQEEQSTLLPIQKELTPAELSLREKLLKPNKDGIVRLSVKDFRRLPKLPFDKEKFDAITDEDIRRGVAEDPDAVPLDLDWSNAKVVHFKPKIAMSIRVDPDIYDFFKAMGKGYQTRMNAVLKAFMEHQKAKK